MRTPRAIAVLASALFVVASPVIAQTHSESVGLEVIAGVALGSETLGFTTSVPEGHFNLADITAAPVFGLGVVLPSFGPGIRPQVRLSYMLSEGIAGNWIPCDPGLVCPAIFLPIDAHADRWQATVGVEVPLVSPGHSVQPYARLGLGARRYGFSWTQIGAGTDTFLLEAGSSSETDLVAGLGLGAAVSLLGAELRFEGSADHSWFGPGTVVVLDEVAPATPTIDLGRQGITEFSLSVGLRKYLD